VKTQEAQQPAGQHRHVTCAAEPVDLEPAHTLLPPAATTNPSWPQQLEAGYLQRPQMDRAKPGLYIQSWRLVISPCSSFYNITATGHTGSREFHGNGGLRLPLCQPWSE